MNWLNLAGRLRQVWCSHKDRYGKPTWRPAHKKREGYGRWCEKCGKWELLTKAELYAQFGRYPEGGIWQ